MNLYDLHSNPKELHGYSTKEYSVPELAYELALVMPELRPKLEPAIMKHPRYAYLYAKFVLERPWPEAEPYIMKESGIAYWYTKLVLKRPWPEAEPAIMKDPYHATVYAIDILKRRWSEAEPYIKKDRISWREYKRKFKL